MSIKEKFLQFFSFREKLLNLTNHISSFINILTMMLSCTDSQAAFFNIKLRLKSKCNFKPLYIAFRFVCIILLELKFKSFLYLESHVVFIDNWQQWTILQNLYLRKALHAWVSLNQQVQDYCYLAFVRRIY